ncbi:MAG: hypothetical protein SRB2_00142 [Desulfobacteraceae bacterium Eth-SRB2]|nr:MAG: hypothetical protein SRB2_00142 [Desulfobacteraceae bacterium Eth-SRB2]
MKTLRLSFLFLLQLSFCYLIMIILFPGSLLAKKTIYFPHVASDNTWETEICLINTNSGSSLSGELYAYNNEGQKIHSENIMLESRARREIIIGNELPSPKNVGYIIFESDLETICGYTKFYIDGKYRVAIPASSEVNASSIYVSHIASTSTWWTGISLLNTNSTAKTLTIEFDNGTTITKTIQAGEHQAFTIKSLFQGNAQPDFTSAIIKNGAGIVGLELFGGYDSSGNNYLSGILLRDDTATDIYYPHIASDSTWWTGVVAYNPFTTPCTLTITPYKTDGTALSSQTISLAGNEKYIGTINNLNFPSGTVWFSIKSTGPITGFELFGTNDGNQLGGYTGVGISATEGIFAKVEKGGGWTGIAFVNIKDSSATVTMTAYNDNGNVIEMETLTVGAYAKIVGVAPSLFSQNINNATYIGYSSNKEVVGFQLNGSSDGMLLDGLPGIRSGGPNEKLKAVQTWMYQIQDLDVDGALAALAASDYPLLVIEPGHNFNEWAYDTATIVNTLRTPVKGSDRRLVVAYIDIGQAEDYRDYWGADWVAPTATKAGSPDFLVTIDPDGWSGNYPVAYWKQEWKDIWIGDSGIIDQLANYGFDGIYLDWVEAYDDEKVIAAAAKDNVDPALEMIKFIEELGQAGRAVSGDFIVIPQNAPYLIDAAPARYSRAIDALAVEDTWFHGAGDADWDDPDAGDLHERHDGEWSTENRLKQYKKYQDRGLPVFSVDYCISTENANYVYTEAAKAGLVPLVTRVSLSRMTETPLIYPPAGSLFRDFTFSLPIFSSASPWNQKVNNSTVVPQNDQQILTLYRVLRGDTTGFQPPTTTPVTTWPFIDINYDAYSVPIFAMGSGVQNVTVKDYNGNVSGNNSKLPTGQDGKIQVPTLAGNIRPAGPQDTDADGHMVLFNTQTGIVYDFWQVTTSQDASGNSLGGGQTGTNILAMGAVDYFDTSATGINADSISSARATGVPLLAGLILPEDIESGSIDHALCFAIPFPRNLNTANPFEPFSTDYFSPASTTETDYYSTNANALAAGQTIRLKQILVDEDGLTIDETGLSPITLMFLKALRTYGGIVVDNAGGFSFYAEDIHTGNLRLTEDQVNQLIGSPIGTQIPSGKTKWQLVLETLSLELEQIPMAYGPWTSGQNPSSATITTSNYEIVSRVSSSND